MKKSVLGKGLSALIPMGKEEYSSQKVVEIPLDQICINPMQPRKKIDDDKIRELADSIKRHGLIQPPIITNKDGLYHLVVGERRFRACKLLELEKIPVIIKESTWEEMLEIALVENIQREDLNPVEEAKAYKMLMTEHDNTQEQVAAALGKSRSYIANMIRLLNLPPLVIEDLESGEITTGHARALLGIEDEKLIMAAVEKIKKENLSVRQTEELVRQLKSETPKKTSSKVKLPRILQDVQNHLTERFATRVNLKSTKGDNGKIEFHYSSTDELNRLLALFGVEEKWY